jgi:transposase InsO family protein
MVSGSSGHLVLAHRAPPGAGGYAGQVLAHTDLDYAEAMQQYAQATQARRLQRRPPPETAVEQPSAWRQAHQAQLARYQVRQQRHAEDRAWKTAKADWRKVRLTKKPASARYQTARQTWQSQRRQRQELLQQRAQEDQAWHAGNQERGYGTHGKGAWLAILVITDNATRQCWGLPVFSSGAQVTSQEVAEALRKHLHAGVQFVISDQGSHFRARVFAQLAQEGEFVHIPIYRHRPQTNGIAERFVQTLKQALQGKPWATCAELETWLATIQAEYNQRPHQGLAIPGLSPNEFARRIWLM